MGHTHSSKLLGRCPLCQAMYQEEAVRLVGEKGSSQLFHCTCHTCGHAMLALILETQGVVSSVGLVTDLEVGDVLRFRDCEPISADECIEVHRMVEEESKEFCKALSIAEIV